MKNKGISKKEEEHFQNLNKKIGELTSKGLFWGKNGAVALEKERIKLNKGLSWYKFTELLSAASSTYYAASGNALSHIGIEQVGLFSTPLWFWRAWRCLRKAEKYSDKFARLKPMENMSLGELDTRACVLNKAGRRNEAAGLLSHGIMKILNEETGTKHDLCLFLIHEAEVLVRIKRYDKKDKAEKNYQQAVKLSEDETVPALTKVRVMKSYGKFLANIGKIIESKDVLNKGLVLAEGNNLADQVVKIKALLAVG